MGETLALNQSVSEARQNSSTRSGTVRLAAMVLGVGVLTMVDAANLEIPREGLGHHPMTTESIP